MFGSLEDMHAKLGNIKKLNLDNNKLFSLDGLSKMYSLEQLSCTGNRLCELSDVEGVSSLPCLEYVWLKDDPLCSLLDYRTKVLELFSERAPEVTLDGIPTTSRELNTVRVLVALNKAKVQQPQRERSSRSKSASRKGATENTSSRRRQRSESIGRTLSRQEVKAMMKAEEQEELDKLNNSDHIGGDLNSSNLQTNGSESTGNETNGNGAAGTSTRTFSQMVSSGTLSNNSSRNGKGELFTACKAVKQVKSGLVMGLTGEVNIDWSALLM